MFHEDINIRSFQHYLYCAHRWGLIEIEKSWEENYYVTKANLLHARVHEAQQYTLRGKRVFTSVPVYHDDLGLYGVLDNLEAVENKDGIYLGNQTKKYTLSIVEHKPTKPNQGDYHYADLMQIYAQKLCVDYVFKTNVRTFIYYADVRSRVELPIEQMKEELYEDFLRIQSEMKEYSRLGIIPEKVDRQQCSGCSFRNLCMPKKPKNFSLRKEIEKILSFL